MTNEKQVLQGIEWLLLTVAMKKPHFSPRLCRGVAFGKLLLLGKCSQGKAMLGRDGDRSATPRQSRGLKLRLCSSPRSFFFQAHGTAACFVVNCFFTRWHDRAGLR